MALVTEDGTGLSNAESYESLSNATAYFAARPSTKAAIRWAASTDAKREGALRSATEWLDARYIFRGSLLRSTQSLAWPRTSVIDRDGRSNDPVPRAIKRATCELAAEHLRRDLNEVLDRGGRTASESVAGVVAVTYEPGAPAERLFAYFDDLLADLVECLREAAGRDSVEMRIGWAAT